MGVFVHLQSPNNIMVTPTTTTTSTTITLSFLLILTVAPTLTRADVNTMTDKILKDILKDYNPDARPAGKLSDRKLYFLSKLKLSEETCQYRLCTAMLL